MSFSANVFLAHPPQHLQARRQQLRVRPAHPSLSSTTKLIRPRFGLLSKALRNQTLRENTPQSYTKRDSTTWGSLQSVILGYQLSAPAASPFAQAKPRLWVGCVIRERRTGQTAGKDSRASQFGVEDTTWTIRQR